MIIKRPRYLNKLIEKKENGLVKVITGVRRSGKSYLLFNLFRDYLKGIGVKDKHIVELALDDASSAKFRNPLELDKYIRQLVKEKSQMYYIFLDEIQKVAEIQNPYIEHTKSTIGFVDVLLGLIKLPNVDLYVTGSNSRMLSSDIITEFRGRGDEIKVSPLTFKEFCSVFKGDTKSAWQEYITYGGMPMIPQLSSHEDKSKYLRDLFTKTYIADVVERHMVLKDTEIFETLINIISSAIGSLTNPTKLSNTFKSVSSIQISPRTISTYLDYLVDAFIINKSQRYDIKGKKYIDTPFKYYFCDVGLRNARLNFRQQEENHIMENIIYNELAVRGFDIDIGMVEYNYKDEFKKSQRSQLEVDFVANKGNVRYYIQSAFAIMDDEKRFQEINPLKRIADSFKKVIVVKDDIIPWHDEYGILYIGIEQFLLDEKI